MAPTPAGRPLVAVCLVAVAGLVPVRLIPWPLGTAGLQVAVVIGLARPTVVPAPLVTVVASVSGWLIRIGLVPFIACLLISLGVAALVPLKLVARLLVTTGVVTIKFVPIRLARKSMLG
jgi:hypothetical protein